MDPSSAPASDMRRLGTRIVDPTVTTLRLSQGRGYMILGLGTIAFRWLSSELLQPSILLAVGEKLQHSFWQGVDLPIFLYFFHSN
jgi:hypothetical protein